MPKRTNMKAETKNRTIEGYMQDEYVQVEEFGPTTRFLHWVRAISICILMASGFYIAYPFLESVSNGEPVNFTQGYVRSVHIMVGFILICASIFRVYLFIFAKSSRFERISFLQFFNPIIWIKVIGTYLFLAKHPHIKGAYNPLQLLVYFALAVLVLVISLTGVAMYCNVYHNGLAWALAPLVKWVEVSCGGLANVRSVHHIATWCFIIFIPVHVYMVIWNSVKFHNGGADVMVSGIRYVKRDER